MCAPVYAYLDNSVIFGYNISCSMKKTEDDLFAPDVEEPQAPPTPEETRKSLITLGILGGMLVIALVLITAFQTPIIEKLKSYKLWPLPEPLTELYFTEHLLLPAEASPGGQMTFPFTIHNIEYKTLDYPYTVRVQAQDNSADVTVIRAGVYLDHDQFATISADFIMPDITTRSAIRVELVDRGEKIHFWVQPGKQ